RGFADGVAVLGNLLLVATGHHSPAKPREQPGDPGYGHGHGLELLDRSDPGQPRRLSRLDLPAFYQIGNDMWSVRATGSTAWVGDSHNGLFEADLSDPAQPRWRSHWRPDWLPDRQSTDYVGGIWPGDGIVYVAGGWSDLQVVEAPSAGPPVEDPGQPVVVGPQPEPPPKPYRVYPREGQVHQVTFAADRAFLALGSAGLEVAQLDDMTALHRYATEGFALDCELVGDRLYVAEGAGGLSVWRVATDGTLALVGRYRTSGSVKQVIIPPPGRYGLLHVGAQELQIVDLGQPDSPRHVLSDRRFGLLYGDQIADGLLAGRWAAVFWHASGVHWYDLAAEPPCFSGDTFAEKMDMTNGIGVCGSKLLIVRDGGFRLIEPATRPPATTLPLAQIAGERLRGKPVVDGDTLYLSHRSSGLVSVLDLSDPANPRPLARYETAGSPGRVVVHDGVAWVPGGYEGLLRLP
ncbi:MAG: hypothetical protein HUU35_15695, partial [Armatimonadetes bacterium]|nr:hypothetical protein [Armatimonadota bacterium]